MTTMQTEQSGSLTFLPSPVDNPQAEVTRTVQGLLARPATVSPKYFYDDLGSRLFGAITALPEYYPTRTEASILRTHASSMGQAIQAQVGPDVLMVELGAGNCEKAAALFEAWSVKRYVAVDISSDYLQDVLRRLSRERPAMQFVGVGLDFATQLTLPSGLVDRPALVFYPGSSISNFAPDQALRLLREARTVAAGGALLIGVDLVKPRERLEPAYDDALGVTAAFNLNLLNHLNRVIGSDFDMTEWKHVAFYDEQASRIEMHLEARRRLVVQFQGHERHFEAGERILTEYSYKWQPQGFEALLREAGFEHVRTWTDEQGWFALMLAS